MNVVPVIYGLSILTLIAQAIILFFLVTIPFRKIKVIARIWSWFGRHALLISLFAALIATTGSLFLSDIAGFEPCKLCWFQRIFMYPLVFLFGIALYRKDLNVFRYALPLSVVGVLIAGYHYGLQVYSAAVPGYSDACAATGVSCVSSHFMTFGYITIPLMAFSAFLLIIIAGLIRK